MARVGLKYLRGAAEGEWLPGVPASDHNAEDAEQARARLRSGLYERTRLVPEPPEPESAPEPEPVPVKLERPPYWWMAPNERPEASGGADSRSDAIDPDSADAEAPSGAASPDGAATTDEEAED